jgi:hypothetical protein
VQLIEDGNLAFRRLVRGLVAGPPANLADADVLIADKGWEGD